MHASGIKHVSSLLALELVESLRRRSLIGPRFCITPFLHGICTVREHSEYGRASRDINMLAVANAACHSVPCQLYISMVGSVYIPIIIPIIRLIMYLERLSRNTDQESAEEQHEGDVRHQWGRCKRCPVYGS